HGALPLCAALVLTACDVPTSAPILEQKWVLPVDGATLSVDKFLPAGVSVVGSTFAVALPNVSVSESLGEMCPACPPVTLTAPTPAFQAQLDASVALPTMSRPRRSRPAPCCSSWAMGSASTRFVRVI